MWVTEHSAIYGLLSDMVVITLIANLSEVIVSSSQARSFLEVHSGIEATYDEVKKFSVTVIVADGRGMHQDQN